MLGYMVMSSVEIHVVMRATITARKHSWCVLLALLVRAYHARNW
jgi:hypothetical protein